MGFRKSHNTQNSFLRMIESWKIRLSNGSKVGVIIMDLFKAFDSLKHELLLAKLKACWFRQQFSNLYEEAISQRGFNVAK